MSVSSEPNASLRHLSREVILFVLFGCLAAVVDYASYRLFIGLDLGPSVSRSGSYILGSVAAFLMNRQWAFKGDGSRSEAVRGAGTYFVIFLIIVSSNWLFLRLFDGFQSVILLAWFLSQALGTSSNFLAQKLFVFRKQAGESA